MTLDEIHIRHCMLYEFRSGSNVKEAHAKICAVYKDALSLRKCERWFARFRSGDFNLNDRSRFGRPLEMDDVVLKSLVESDPKLSSREIAIILKNTHTTVLDHLHKIGKMNKCGIWVPHTLNPEQLLNRTTICASLLARLELDPFIERIITGDEKWVLYVNVERRKQWLSSGQQPISYQKPGLHPKKILLCVWWDMKGILYFELLNMDQRITAEIYCQQLDRLRKILIKKRPALVNQKGVILLHDNAKPHIAKITRKKLKEFGWEVLPHPSFSPDLAPSDYHLFQSLQHFLSDKNFKNKEEIQTAIFGFFNSKPKSFYRKGIEILQQRWERVIENDGEYIID
jgi:[histone H3]-lysine36 N-dimethyltransferase SETMAR